MSGKINVTFSDDEKEALILLGNASEYGTAPSYIAAIVREKLAGQLPETAPKPSLNSRDPYIRTRVSPTEKAEFRARCQLEKVSESVLLRRHIRILLNQIPFFCGNEIQALANTNKQLISIGRNLNQVVKRINSRPGESAEALISNRLLMDIDAHLDTLKINIDDLIKRSRLRVVL